MLSCEGRKPDQQCVARWRPSTLSAPYALPRDAAHFIETVQGWSNAAEVISGVVIFPATAESKLQATRGRKSQPQVTPSGRPAAGGMGYVVGGEETHSGLEDGQVLVLLVSGGMRGSRAGRRASRVVASWVDTDRPREVVKRGFSGPLRRSTEVRRDGQARHEQGMPGEPSLGRA